MKMIRNVKIKKILVNKIFPIFTLINRWVPKSENNILIYCANDELKDNSAALYKFLLDNGYFEKYKITVSGAKNLEEIPKIKSNNITFVSKTMGIFWYMRSKYTFYSVGKIPIRPTKKQMVINMWHGIPCKAIGNLSNLNNGDEFFFSYVCASSEFYRPIMAKAFGCPEENVCICGEPKTDKIYAEQKHESTYKLILWAPTFRQSKYLGYSDSHMSSFLPLIDNAEWPELNKVAKSKNIKIIVKLHSAQNLNGFTEKLYSNLEVYSDSAFRRHGYNLYDFMAQSDALLADYSSVYLEYLLLNRPIGFTLEDIDEYKDTRGFVFENPLDYMPGEKLYSKSELFQFLDDIAECRDTYTEERERVCNLVHQYKDGRNCERIISIAGMKK